MACSAQHRNSWSTRVRIPAKRDENSPTSPTYFSARDSRTGACSIVATAMPPVRNAGEPDIEVMASTDRRRATSQFLVRERPHCGQTPGK
jgi:hypothetical protein